MIDMRGTKVDDLLHKVAKMILTTHEDLKWEDCTNEFKVKLLEVAYDIYYLLKHELLMK